MCTTPGSGAYKRMYRDGKVFYKSSTTGEEIEQPPALTPDLLADFRILEHLVGLETICKHTGYSVLGTKVFQNNSLGGHLCKTKYDKLIQLRTKVYKNHSVDTIKSMKLDFVTHPTFRAKSRRHLNSTYKRPKESIELIKLAKRDKRFNVIHPGINDSTNNRPNGSGHRYEYTEEIYRRLLSKSSNIGKQDVASKIGYSLRHTRKLLKDSFVGKLLDPHKAPKLIQYANSLEDL